MQPARVGKLLLRHFALQSESFDRQTEIANGMHRRLVMVFLS
jgi:hypothetical protein